MTDKYKQMCGCEVCILAVSLQNDLNTYRLSLIRRMQQSRIDRIKTNEYRSQVYNNNKHVHPHPKDALLCIQYPPVDSLKCLI